MNDWLKRLAFKNEFNRASRSYVVCNGNTVVGYYCLAAGNIVRASAPKSMQRNMPDPIPAVVLGRLAVDLAYQGQGIGTSLLKDAILRVYQAAEIVGIRTIFVNAISDEAKSFYLSWEFLESPSEPLTLCLPLSSIRQNL